MSAHAPHGPPRQRNTLLLQSIAVLILARTLYAFVSPTVPSRRSVESLVAHRVVPVLLARVGGGFGFGKKKTLASEVDDLKYFEGTIYSPYPGRRPLPPFESTPCACGSDKSYGQCCFPLHKGEDRASTPEALLRSRYSAYVHGFPRYLLATTHPSSAPMRPKRLKAYLELLEIACSEENLKQLQIGVQEAGATEEEVFITFRVKRHVWMSERSKFLRGEDGGWLFLDEQV